MRALIVADRPHWSYMRIAEAIQRYNPDPDLRIDVTWLKGKVEEFWKRERLYDRVLLMGWQQTGLLDEAARWVPWYRYRMDRERWLTGIHSHHSWDDGETTPEQDVTPPQYLVDLLDKFRAVNAVSKRLTRLFAASGLSVMYTANGVDTDAFRPISDISPDGPLRVGVAYTPKHDARKGVSEFILPACQKVGALLVEAKARSGQRVHPEDMPEWHNSYDVYVCASSSEGFSIAVLEAAASGRPIVSTRVGGSTELVQHGFNGYLVDRSVDAIMEALEKLQDRKLLAWMGWNARAQAVTDWSWRKRVRAWIEFLVI